MSTRSAADFLAAGNAGLDRGEWACAKAAFESALNQGETAEALEGLGQALWWLNDLHTAIERWEHAYAEFRARYDLRSAGRIATRLGREYFTFHGNFAAGGGLAAAGRAPARRGRTVS